MKILMKTILVRMMRMISTMKTMKILTRMRMMKRKMFKAGAAEEASRAVADRVVEAAAVAQVREGVVLPL